MRPAILDLMEVKYGFKVFDDGHDYDLNIIGIRNPNPSTPVDKFDDQLVICYQADGEWHEEKFRCTTDPSLHWLLHPGRVRGTAILKHPQQVRGGWKIRKHRGSYLALCQKLPCVVWRDADKDAEHDHNVDEQTGIWGINIHRASRWRDSAGPDGEGSIGRYSAGCTVVSDPQAFARVMWLAHKQIELHPTWKTFTYTLLCEDY